MERLRIADTTTSRSSSPRPTAWPALSAPRAQPNAANVPASTVHVQPATPHVATTARRHTSPTSAGDAAVARIAAALAVAQHRNSCSGWRDLPHRATDLTAGRVVPEAHGGTYAPENIQLLCRSCNSRKHSTTTD
ncbi:HNH endonuclease signature motif containing protein [Streptomyces sp. NPDC016566]|uniref:HNH endonuclease signature motif containing protein n=1 Tax=Streptomyces sp. NPDC016566 TaxID=3364967 RepID=UPI0036FC4F70